jgi:hypothetical protein
VWGCSERYDFYSGKRKYNGSEGCQAVYYLTSRNVILQASEEKVRWQEADCFENAAACRRWAVTVLALNWTIKALPQREHSHLHYTDQPATTVSGKLV